VEEAKLPFGLHYWSKPSYTRGMVIVEMMKASKYISPDNVRKIGGGSLDMVKRVIEKNKEIIDAHNRAIEARIGK
jgi:hypothetical protein